MNNFQSFDWYDQALYYDIVFDADTAREAAFLEAVAARHGTSGGRRALEPGCGSGRLVAEMARRGWRVTGFDASDPMLEFARRRLASRDLGATLRRDRMESFRVHVRGRFDLAFCTVGTFRYLLDERSARAHLHRVASSLRPGGVYAVGLHTTEYDDPCRRRERWVERRNGVHVVCNIQSWPADRRARTQRWRSRLTATERGVERRFETCWTFRTYDPRQLRRTIRAVPTLEHVATYGFDYDLARPATLDGDQLDVVLVLRRIHSP